MEAIVLAGGLGTRLRARVGDRPKPMAEVAGRPFLALLLHYLETQGFTRAVLSVGYRHEAISGYFGSRQGAIELCYAVETEPLGTGGAIAHALAESLDNPLWVLNGDTMLHLDYHAMLVAHARGKPADMRMALRRIPDVTRYGAVQLDGDRVTGFAASGTAGAGLINSGVYLLSRALFHGQELPRVFSFERDFLPVAVEQDRVAGFVTDALFIDIGVPEDYDRAQTLLAGGG